LLAQAGLTILIASSAYQAREVFAQHSSHVVLLDYMLGDDDGVKLGLEFQSQAPHMQVIIMTGGILSPAEEAICQERDIPVLRKPFLASHLMQLFRHRLAHSSFRPSVNPPEGKRKSFCPAYLPRPRQEVSTS